jgi:hypothetical protein
MRTNKSTYYFLSKSFCALELPHTINKHIHHNNRTQYIYVSRCALHTLIYILTQTSHETLLLFIYDYNHMHLDHNKQFIVITSLTKAIEQFS